MSKALLERPIFLVGAERSGTTLLRLMLDHHPEIRWCNEFEYSVDYIAPDGTFPTLEDYYENLEVDRIFQTRGFAIDRTLSYPELVDSFLRQHRATQGKPIIGATVHRHFDRLLAVWPDARFIHITRDGRDVARSCVGMNWAGNIWVGADRWIEAENLWADMTRSLDSDRYVEVRYEDVITQPETVLADICAFIGVAYDEAMLAYPQDTTYSAPDRKLISQWRKKLSELEIQLIEARIGDMLVERGYELSGLPAVEVSPQQVRQLLRQSHWKRTWKRVQFDGLPLFVTGYLARRLGIKPLIKYVTLQSNRKMQATLK